jgi:hypothetical protein
MPRAKANGVKYVTLAYGILLFTVFSSWTMIVFGTYLRDQFGKARNGPSLYDAGFAFGVYGVGALLPVLLVIIPYFRRRKVVGQGRPSVSLGGLAFLFVLIWSVVSTLWIANAVFRVEYREEPVTIEEKLDIGLPPPGHKPMHQSAWSMKLPDSVSFVCTVTGWLLALALCLDIINVPLDQAPKK